MDVADRVRSEAFVERIAELWERTGDDGLAQIVAGRSLTADPAAPPLRELEPQEHADWVSTALMQAFQRTGDPQVFATLYELNEASFAQAIQGKLRRTISRVDRHDVLQEVFLNIYRYPHRFVAERADAFRNWGHRIVQNTLLKFLKLEARRQRTTHLDEDLGERVDVRAESPLRSAANAEQHRAIDRAFLIYLNLYLVHFRQLSQKEQRALTLVEVDGSSYRDAAGQLGIRLENLKMVVFRARRKIDRGMSRTMAELEARGRQLAGQRAAATALTERPGVEAPSAARAAADPASPVLPS
jgi:RNA polymerase sigma-70 factor (ECF subfamily)